jgi:hypothetical protein
LTSTYSHPHPLQCQCETREADEEAEVHQFWPAHHVSDSGEGIAYNFCEWSVVAILTLILILGKDKIKPFLQISQSFIK